MRFSQLFDDLEDFITAYRGRISRDGMLVHTDTLYQEGTVLVLEIALAKSLPLIRGTAGVVHLMRGIPETETAYSIVLEFLQLDQNSVGFIKRLMERLEAEGAEQFVLDRYFVKGRRGIQSDFGEPVEATSEAAEELDAEAPASDVTVPTEPTAESAQVESVHRLRAVAGLWPWLVGIAASAVVVAVAALIGFADLPSLWIAALPEPGPVLANALAREDRDRPTIPATNPLTRSTTAVPVSAERSAVAAHHPALGMASRIERIFWTDTDSTTVVSVQADGQLSEAAVGHFVMSDEPQPRIVLYLYGISSEGLAYRTSVGGVRLDAVRVWYHRDKQPEQVHIVFDLANGSVEASAPVIEGKRVVITLIDSLATAPAGKDPTHSERPSSPVSGDSGIRTIGGDGVTGTG